MNAQRNDRSGWIDVSLMTLGSPDTLSGGYLYHRRVARLAPACGASFRFVSFPRGPFPLPAFAVRRILSELASQQPDVVLVDSIAASYAALLRSRLARIAPVATIMHQPPGGMERGAVGTALSTALDQRMLAGSAHVFAASDDLGDLLLASGVPLSSLTVVPPGCDSRSGATETAGATPCSEPAPPSGQRPGASRRSVMRHGRRAAAACVANWTPRKGILELLEATSMLPDSEVFLHLAGDGGVDRAYGAAVRRRLQDRDLRGRTEVHGRLSPADVAVLYERVDLFALASTQEPYGTAYGEAMAAGLPVVGWRAGNLPNLATHGVEALIVEPGDIAALAAAMSDLASDEVRRRSMGEAALRRAAAFPSWEQTACSLVAQLRRVVQKQQQRSPTPR